VEAFLEPWVGVVEVEALFLRVVVVAAAAVAPGQGEEEGEVRLWLKYFLLRYFLKEERY
jgi:hypothetical protein